jgi:microcystin degradation protein MlrC
MIKAAIGGFFHETNTYATASMGSTTAGTMIIRRGQAILDQIKGTNVQGGYVDAFLEKGYELAPTAFYFFDKSFGTVDAATYARAKDEILQGIRDAMPLDVVILINHGAGVVEGTPDLEGDLAAAVRELVGPEVKIVGTLDLHGKCSAQSAASFDFLNACHLYPHNDINARNREVVEYLPGLLSGKLLPTLHVEHLPIAFAVCTTDKGTIAAEILERVRAMQQRPEVLDCSVLHGFPYQDSEFVGMYVMVTTDNDVALAQHCAAELANWIWANRQCCLFQGHSCEQALARAEQALAAQGRTLCRTEEPDPAMQAYGFLPDEQRQGPVVICDYGDNPGSGGAGDNTHLLKAMLDARVEQACMLAIRDPATVQQAISAGVGATIEVHLGGKIDHPRGGDPITGEAYVKSISDGRIKGRGVDKGMNWDVGPSVRLITGGIDVVVMAGAVQTFDDSLGRAHGIVAQEYRLVALKSANHFREYYRDIACEIIVADAPGLGAGDVTLFQYTQAPFAVFPHDAAACYPITERSRHESGSM